MESITMTTTTQISSVLSVCPQANPIRLAATRVWIQGTTVSGVASDARGVFAVKVRPAPYAGRRFGATAPKTTVLDHLDVVHLRTGEPPV
ncbi:hypothetical protein [Knoellia sp. p5-6-4]|uniref:hypothetical protein n=1 Tax=unclassified Knoellia TaxID=2618719 RepID=UPI0023DB86F8|nr:hypothetical protein [Knoellia sp. p5-6-4]MDF2144240.1 hypothetical protein [Knoellia sp. p5-6-4]